MKERPTFFYGWLIVGIAVVGMVLTYGTRHSFSVFFPPILDEFGWSRGSTALMLSLNILIYGFTAPFAGGLVDRWKPRKVLPIGVTILFLSTASCAWASELWHFYLLFGVLVPIGIAFAGWPVMGPTLANWFYKKRGLALGIGGMGAGLSYTYGLFVEFIISQVGWRYAYVVIATILVLVMLPLYFLFYQYRPESKGLKPYGAAGTEKTDEPGAQADLPRDGVSHEWTLRRALRTHQLWLFIISHSLFWGVGGYMVLAHQVKFAMDMGYSSLFAASVFALFGVFMAAGQLSGFLSDWIGREKTVTLSSILVIGALVALISVKDASQPWLLYIYAICFGYGAGLYSPTITAGEADIFHGRNFGAIAGLSLTGVGIGSVFGPWLGGYIYDISGSYIAAFILCIICFGINCLAFWIAAPRKASTFPRREIT